MDRIFGTIGYIGIVCYGVYALVGMTSALPQVKVAGIRVEGVVRTDELLARTLISEELDRCWFAGIRSDNPILFPEQAVASVVASSSPEIDRVRVELAERRAVARITERSPDFLWCGDDATASSSRECFYANEDGYIFRRAPFFDGTPFLVLFGNVTEPEASTTFAWPLGRYALAPDESQKVLSFARALGEMGFAVREVVAEGGTDYLFDVGMPWRILWTSVEPVDMTIGRFRAALPVILEDAKALETMRVVDLRFGEKIFYR